jgi:hypothetical protein
LHFQQAPNFLTAFIPALAISDKGPLRPDAAEPAEVIDATEVWLLEQTDLESKMNTLS